MKIALLIFSDIPHLGSVIFRFNVPVSGCNVGGCYNFKVKFTSIYQPFTTIKVSKYASISISFLLKTEVMDGARMLLRSGGFGCLCFGRPNRFDGWYF